MTRIPWLKAFCSIKGWFKVVLLYRPALAVAVLVLQADHIRQVWSDYDPTLLKRLSCSMTKVASVSGMDQTVNPVEVRANRLHCEFGSEADTIYIYVYYGFFDFAPGEQVVYLAFKYHGANPKLSWQHNRLQIAIHGPVDIERQLSQTNEVPVDYVFDPLPAP